MSADTVHVFEAAGLGKAPFKLVDLVTRVGPYPLGGGSYMGAPGQPVGCCKFCGESIATCCVIESADGKRFDVGNVCVYKTGDGALMSKTKQAIAKKNTETRHERERARIAWGAVNLPRAEATWKAQPHPYKDMAARGLTLWEWARWRLANAGNKGKLEVVKRLEELLGVKAS